MLHVSIPQTGRSTIGEAFWFQVRRTFTTKSRGVRVGDHAIASRAHFEARGEEALQLSELLDEIPPD